MLTKKTRHKKDRADIATASFARLTAAVLAVMAWLPSIAIADAVRAAVAANFTEAAKEIGALFEAETGHAAILSFGSTGQLYTQITQGAPFDVFLAADQDRPRLAVEQGFAVPDSRFTYVTGKIVLFSNDPDLVKGKATLREGAFTRLAIANPVTAPYGAAAVEALTALGLYDDLRPKIVQGNNIAQTYQFVATSNAELGFVARAQIAGHDRGSRWLVPDALYRPIAQDAVLLTRGADNAGARAFVAFLQSPAARRVTEKYGYGAGE